MEVGTELAGKGDKSEIWELFSCGVVMRGRAAWMRIPVCVEQRKAISDDVGIRPKGEEWSM